MTNTCKPLLSRRSVLRAGGAAALVISVPARLRSGVLGPALTDAGELSLARFAPYVGSRFTVKADGEKPVAVTLLRAEEWRPRRPDRPGLMGESFSLILGDGQPKAFDQGMHTLAHPQLGSFRLLVVPVGAGEEGQRYQVVVDQRRLAP